MIHIDEQTNAQGWELEVACKNHKYLKAVVKTILKYGMIDFEVETVEYSAWQDGFDARYTVLMWGSWFGTLNNITRDLAKIEKKLD